MRTASYVIFWAIATAIVVALISLPISLQAHLIAGTIVVGAMILLKFLRPYGVWRLIALGLGTAIVLRYVYWRTTSTLPPVNQLEDFIPGLILYLAELYNIGMLFLSLFVVAMPLPRRKSAPPIPADAPTVDVFVPTYNEEPELLATTLSAALAMDYPAGRLSVYLLDDGGTDEKCNVDNFVAASAARERRAALQTLCEGLGVTYLTRERNISAKAGNLNNGLANSSGDLVVVFDADHAPARNFLTETVGYFDRDPKLFLVQTPHFFINPDPLERNLKTFKAMPSENEMFYGIIQRGLDKWNASFFCGSAAVLRRTALQTTNGFSGRSITEDAETAITLHATGWNSIYVDKPLIAGLQPATFASFIGQRSRWAQGMMQILIYHRPMLKSGLSLPQRLCYSSSALFWLFPFVRLTFLVAPLFYLFFGLEIFTASGAEFIAYVFSYMAVNLMMQNYLYGRYRWPWISELYEFIQSVYLLPAVVSVLLNPGKPTFKVTAKSEELGTRRISELGLPFFIIFAVLALGVVATYWRTIAQPYNADTTLVVGLWNILNLLMAGCALGVVSERPEGRGARRFPVKRRGEISIDGRTAPIVTENVSVDGVAVRVLSKGFDTLPLNSKGEIAFQTSIAMPSGALPVRIVRQASDEKGLVLGCRYEPSEPLHSRIIADLCFSDAGIWSDFQKARRQNMGVVYGTLRFLRIAVFQTSRGLSYFFGLYRFARSNPARKAAE
ncbi:UDP-forming cellulose synthase catalytic subunit [Bosea sp. (in: a-proteobacteria)]|jgi:cellulose synthase (UDP-forming)|uniref:UDP-forming cellulose synthase catalytic subunit n=1 Tax=Bosea sp. (in: a-proteobacteria) TaxID=1871050 RepID=UPI0025C2FADE|nr:UDP-forming cellulose synthase catalytic subunit [Bosea sp. (in: a-proteobacteria)]MBR3190024.1 UDP-forming cellulose synthase catalytic subunit [Bosea sp. (in: a-proteobacteria)]